MLMIPLPFLFAAAALWALWVQWRGPTPPHVYLVLCLVLLALQMGLIGVRFGYGVGWLGLVQQAVAVIVPPLIWLAFVRPPVTAKLVLKGLPLVGLAGLAWLWPVAVDGYIALVGLGYAGALARLGLAGEAALPWVPFGQVLAVRRWIWAAAVLLVAAGLTDVAAGAAAVLGAAGWTGPIIAVVMVLGGVLALAILRRDGKMLPRSAGVRTDAGPVFARVEKLLTDGAFRDPDLTLQRIARKLTLPQRDVSRAVNDGAGVNLSQYVNGFRVQAACDALRQTDRPVTQVMFEVGFMTKSNFNKEFTRVTGVTPSVWRRKGVCPRPLPTAFYPG